MAIAAAAEDPDATPKQGLWPEEPERGKDYAASLCTATGGPKAARDARTDAEVLTDARAHEPFPTLMAAVEGARDPEGRPLSARERRAARRAFRHDLKAAGRERRRAERDERAAEREERRRYKSVGRQLRERDRELSDRSEAQRQARRRARGVYGAIGFDRMFRNGVCEVEE